MTDTSTDPRLSDLDGFRVEIDPDRQRGDIILSRPPMNVIWMGQRDQLRVAFEELDADDRVRVIVLRAEGAISRRAVTSEVSLMPRPSMSAILRTISPRPGAARNL